MEFRSCRVIDNMELAINGRIDTGEKVIGLCCEDVAGAPRIAFRDTARETLEAFLAMHAMVVAESMKNTGEGAHISGCEKCVNYYKGEHTPGLRISHVNLSLYPSPCQSHCCYCGAKRHWIDTPEVAAAYEKMFEMIELAKKSGIIQSGGGGGGTTWQISCGEITIHPYKNRIIDLVKGESARFYTNAFLFDEDIARNLHDNPGSSISLSIDSGTSETWRRVKGEDNFEKVLENLERYHECSAKPEQITLKYIVLPGINDTVEDYTALMKIMKHLEIPQLILSRDLRPKYTMKPEERERLINAASSLAVVCQKNGIDQIIPDHFSGEERAAIRRQMELKNPKVQVMQPETPPEPTEILPEPAVEYHRPLWKRVVNSMLRPTGYEFKRIENRE